METETKHQQREPISNDPLVAQIVKESGYALTTEELAIAGRFAKKQKHPKARVKVEGTGICYDHEEPAIGQLAVMEAIGAIDGDFLSPFISQLVNVASSGQAPQENQINFMLSVIKGIEPQDQIETMLGAQMAAIHMATMTAARQFNHIETLEQKQVAEKTLNKLARTFTTQMAALKKYRTGGEQKVKVEHVHVHEGGQAVVGDVSHTTVQGGGDGEK